MRGPYWTKRRFGQSCGFPAPDPPAMSIFLTILFSIPLLSLAWYFWALRRLRRMGSHPVWSWFVSVGTLAVLAGFIWIVLHRGDRVAAPAPAVLHAAVLLWGLVFLPLLALPAMLGWSVWRSASGLARLLRSTEPAAPAEESIVAAAPAMDRRKMLATTVLALPTLATAGSTLISIPQVRHFRVREIDVPLAGLPRDLEGLSIAHISDVHVGKFTHGRILDELAETTNRLRPDLVLVTGDLIDHSLGDLPEAIAMLKKIDPGAGLFLCEGNHDLFEGREAFAYGVAEGGINLLRNRSIVIDVKGRPVEIMGAVWQRREDAIAGDVAGLAARRQSEAFPILLHHHPHAFDAAAAHGIPLTLAGHTHGGQLMLTPEIGPGPMMYRYWSGLYRKGGAAAVVSNGAGNWFPLRTQAPAEIVRITLRRA